LAISPTAAISILPRGPREAGAAVGAVARVGVGVLAAAGAAPPGVGCVPLPGAAVATGRDVGVVVGAAAPPHARARTAAMLAPKTRAANCFGMALLLERWVWSEASIRL